MDLLHSRSEVNATVSDAWRRNGIGRMIPVEWTAGNPGKNSHLRGFDLPPGTANDPAGPRRGPLRIPARAPGIIRRIVPIGDPFPDVTRHIIDP